MNKDNIIKKIKKCLALSSSDNSHEAALAIERAHALMEKYKITLSDIELAEISGHRTGAGRTQNPPMHIAILAHLVKNAFGCEFIFIPEIVFDRCFSHVEFVGFGPNPEVAAYTFSVLLRQLERGRKAFLKGLSKRMKKVNKSRLASNWADGWAMEVYKKVKEMALSDGDKEKLEAWMERRFNKRIKCDPKKTKKMGERGASAYFEGKCAGRNVQLHRGMTGQDNVRLEQ